MFFVLREVQAVQLLKITDHTSLKPRVSALSVACVVNNPHLHLFARVVVCRSMCGQAQSSPAASPLHQYEMHHCASARKNNAIASSLKRRDMREPS
jgi:hypothetical protein